MTRSSADIFKKSIDKEFSKIPGLDSKSMMDAVSMKQSFKEEKDENNSRELTLQDIASKYNVDFETLEDQFLKGVNAEKKNTKNRKEAIEIVLNNLADDPKFYTKKINNQKNARLQFAKDLQTDPDFIEFKKNAKYLHRGGTESFGIPNVSKTDPYIKKKKFARAGKEETKEATGTGSTGGFVGKVAFADSDFVRDSFKETPKLQKEEVEKVEAKEATTGVGGYSTPAMWAKSTKKKDWGPSRKTQYKGGQFVKVKKKCTTFPYCNQGDINALKLTKNESVKEAIKSLAKKLNLSESVIVNILEQEYKKMNKRVKQ